MGGVLSVQKDFTYILYLNPNRKVARSYKQNAFLNILVKAAISGKLFKEELVAINIYIYKTCCKKLRGTHRGSQDNKNVCVGVIGLLLSIELLSELSKHFRASQELSTHLLDHPVSMLLQNRSCSHVYMVT